MASSIALVAHGIAGAADIPTVTFDSTGADYIGNWLSYGSGTDAPTDSKGNSYTRRVHIAGPINSSGGYGSLSYWDCKSPTVGASHSIYDFHNGVYTSLAASAWSGVYTTTDPYDTSTTNSSNSASSLAPGTVTPTYDGSLLLFASWFEQTSGTYSVSGGYTQLDYSNEVPGAGIGLIVSYLIQGAKTSSNPTGTPTSSSAIGVALAAIRPASYSGGTTYNQSVSATTTPNAAIVRRTGKPVAANTTPNATISRSNRKPVSASTTPVAAIVRANAKVINIDTTPVATIAAAHITPQPSGATLYAIATHTMNRGMMRG